MTDTRRYAIDSSVRRAGDGTVLIGGSPLKLFRLTSAGARLIDSIESGMPFTPSPAIDALIDRLVDAGVLHPISSHLDPDAAARVGDITVVIPAYNTSHAELTRLVLQCRDCGAASLAAIVIVDDASEPPLEQIAGTTVVRVQVNGGPSASRALGLAYVSTPIVAFVDTDVELTPDWLTPLLGHFADVRVGLVAPRVASTAGISLLARYETLSSPLDLGDQPARIRSGTRVSYVPAALMVCRVDALRSVNGFDPTMRVGEDVDLVWRLDAAGWQVRYEPVVTVHHRPRATWGAWLRQRRAYGSSAAPLAQRHPGALAPVRVSVWSAASWLAVAVGLPIVGGAVAAVTTALLVRKMRAIPDGPRQAVRLAGLGHLFAGRSLASGVSRAWWPLTLAAALLSKRARRVALVALTVPATIDWLKQRPSIDPARYIALRVLDDLAYGSGLWQGCAKSRSVDALVPDLTSWPNAAPHPAPRVHQGTTSPLSLAPETSTAQ